MRETASRRSVMFPALVRFAHGPLGPRPRSAPREESSSTAAYPLGLLAARSVDALDEVAVPSRQASDIVAGDGQLDLVVDVGPLRVVEQPLGDEGPMGHEGEGRPEVGEQVGAAQHVTVAPPLGVGLQQLGDLVFGQQVVSAHGHDVTATDRCWPAGEC